MGRDGTDLGDRQEPPPPGLAVLGGSFNPPHTSHLRIGREALAQLNVERLLVIPSGDHPHKRAQDLAPAEHRLAMARLAFAGVDGALVDDRELRREGPSFTVDTLAELRRQAPRSRIYFLIGSDNLPLLPTWHDHHRLLRLTTVVTWPRTGYPIEPRTLDHPDLSSAERAALLANTLRLPSDGVSASELRTSLRTGQAAPAALPSDVADYIREHGLYR